MSYVRWGENSYAYIYPSRQGIVCAGCLLDGDEEEAGEFITTSRAEMIEHVEQHRKAGHKVPVKVDERLRREIAEFGDNPLEDDE